MAIIKGGYSGRSQEYPVAKPKPKPKPKPVAPKIPPKPKAPSGYVAVARQNSAGIVTGWKLQPVKPVASTSSAKSSGGSSRSSGGSSRSSGGSSAAAAPAAKPGLSIYTQKYQIMMNNTHVNVPAAILKKATAGKWDVDYFAAYVSLNDPAYKNSTAYKQRVSDIRSDYVSVFGEHAASSDNKTYQAALKKALAGNWSSTTFLQYLRDPTYDPAYLKSQEYSDKAKWYVAYYQDNMPKGSPLPDATAMQKYVLSGDQAGWQVYVKNVPGYATGPSSYDSQNAYMDVYQKMYGANSTALSQTDLQAMITKALTGGAGGSAETPDEFANDLRALPAYQQSAEWQGKTSAYAQEYQVLFGSDAFSAPSDLLQQAVAGNWSQAYFDQQVRENDPNYFQSQEAQQRAADLNTYWQTVFPGQPVDADFLATYLRGSMTQAQVTAAVTSLPAFKAAYPDYQSFIAAQSGLGNATADPGLYRAYQTQFQNAYQAAGLGAPPTDYLDTFFTSGLTPTQFQSNLGQYQASKGAGEWVGLNPQAQEKNLLFNGPGSDALRTSLQQALGTQQNFNQSKAAGFQTQQDNNGLVTQNI